MLVILDGERNTVAVIHLDGNHNQRDPDVSSFDP